MKITNIKSNISLLFLPLKNFISYILFFAISLMIKSKTAKSLTTNNVLLINTEKIGDLVMAYDFINSIMVSNKYDQKYLLICENYSDLFNYNSPNQKIISFNHRRYKYSIIYRIKKINQLRELGLKYAINITPERGSISDELTLLSGAAVPICLKDKSPYLSSYILDKNNNLYAYIISSKWKNEYDQLRDLAFYLDISIIKNAIMPFLNINLETLLPFKKNMDYIAIAPSASNRIRNWPFDNFKKVIESLSKSYRIILLGTLQQKKMINKISVEMFNVYNCAGKYNLKELPVVIKNAKLFIGLDSGLTHMALQLNVPLIAIIGGGKAGVFFPYKENEHSKFLFHQMECFGCNWKCIYDKPLCITKVTSNEVIQNAFSIIEK